MSELDDVLDVLASGDSQRLALATVVATSGSTYRRSGARLVVAANGPTVGNISGGCLEGDVVRSAGEALASGRSQILHFDLTADDDIVWGWGLGCNGVIDVLVEPAVAARPSLDALRVARREDRAVALVTVLDGPQLGRHLVVHPDGSIEASLDEAGLGDTDLDEAAQRQAIEAMAEGANRTTLLATGVRALVEVHRPPLRLVVCGAGHDAIPLVAAGASLGWRVEVVDDREAFLNAERFPEALRFVRSEPAQVSDRAGVDERSYVVVMSHNFLRDQDYLGSLVNSDAAYIGVLGPGERLDQLLSALAADGTHPGFGVRERIHGPAGLDLGAEGPEEIAWSIVTEILAVSRRAGAGFLRRRAGPIHPPRDSDAPAVTAGR